MLSSRSLLNQQSFKCAHPRQSPRCHVGTGSSGEFSRGAAQFQRTVSKRAQDFRRSAQEFVNHQGKKVGDIIEEQTPNITDKAQKAATTAQHKFQDLYAEVQDNARRTFWKLDTEYRLNEKARRAKRRVEQAAVDLDQQYSVKSRVRAVTEDVQRKWPTWQRQAQEFFATTPGKLVLAIGLGLLFSTGLIWNLLNLLMVLWWLSLPLSLFSLGVAQKRQQEAYRKAAQQQSKQRQGWAGFPGFGRAAGNQQGGGSRSGMGGQGGGGQVIDAEYTVVSDDKKRRW